MKAIKEYAVTKNVRKAVRPIDKTIWCMTPREVNCAYNPVTNAIHIAGGYAQGAMYNINMSDEEMLCKIGRVVVLEISHAFDSTGAQFDEFLNFYGITEGDGMYLAPEDRVAIW